MAKLPIIEYYDVSDEQIDYWLSNEDYLLKLKDDKEAWCSCLTTDDEIINHFTLYFFSKNNEGKIKGYATDLKVKHKNRNALVTAFTLLMYEFFPNLNRFEIFNGFQQLQWQEFEKSGYLPYSKEDKNEIDQIMDIDSDPLIMIKSKSNFQGMVYVPRFSV